MGTKRVGKRNLAPLHAAGGSNPEKSSKPLILTLLGVMAALGIAVFILSSPSSKLLGESLYAFRSAFHGLFAGGFMITLTIGVYQAARLWAGHRRHIPELEAGSLFTAFACLMTIVTGNWLYIPYRAAEGPRAHFLQTDPSIHKIFFEFKEYTALFTLPLVVAATFIICRYGNRLNENPRLRELVSILLVLAFFYFVFAFGLGAAITKIKSV